MRGMLAHPATAGISADGDTLIDKAFGFDEQIPVIQFNSMESESHRECQRGTMYLFKGIIGLCNSKAHRDRLFDDPHRTHEYLALAQPDDEDARNRPNQQGNMSDVIVETLLMKG